MTKAQVEVITSVQRRRHWSRAEKEQIVAAAMEPGAVASDVLRVQPGSTQSIVSMASTALRAGADSRDVQSGDDHRGSWSAIGIARADPIVLGRGSGHCRHRVCQGRTNVDIRTHVFAAERIHADDTTVPVLAKGKTRISRLWAYDLLGGLLIFLRRRLPQIDKRQKCAGDHILLVQWMVSVMVGELKWREP